MEQDLITYEDKVALDEQPSVADINKVKDTDMNQIKNVINGINNGSQPLNNLVVGNIESKNLFDVNDAKILNAYINNKTITILATARTLYIPCESDTTYTISKIQSTRFTVISTVNTPANNVVGTNEVSDNSATSLTITTGSSDKYLVVFYYNSSSDTLTEQEILNSIQIEKGATATPYTPYIVFNNDFNAKVVYRKKMMTGESDTYTFPSGDGLYLLVAHTNGGNSCIMDVIMKAENMYTSRIKDQSTSYKSVTYSTTTVTMNNTNYTGIYSIIKLY